MIHRAERIATLEHRAARVVLCGLTIAVLFAIGRGLRGESLVLTPGYGVVTWALAPDRSVALLLAVLMLAVAGALLGRAFGGAVGNTDSLFLVIGIAAFLGAGYRVPLAAIVFVAEATDE